MHRVRGAQQIEERFFFHAGERRFLHNFELQACHSFSLSETDALLVWFSLLFGHVKIDAYFDVVANDGGRNTGPDSKCCAADGGGGRESGRCV